MGAMGRLAIACLVLVAGSASAGPRVAASSPPPVAWRAPAGCPSSDDLRARIEQRLERSLDDVSLGVEVDVTLAAGRYLARIDLAAVTVANDVRTLTSKRCSELTDAVAVIVARVAGEHLTRQRVALAAEPFDASEPVLADSFVAGTPDATVPRRWTLGARLSGVNGIGVLPQVGVGAELAVTLRADHHLVELGATRWFTSTAQLYTGRPRKVDVDLDVAVARYGWRPYEMPLRAWMGLEVGNMRGTGLDLPAGQLEGGRWIAAGAGFGIAWQMRPWIRLFGSTEAMLAIERVRFAMESGVVAYAPAPMSVRTTCGLEVGWQ